MRKIGTLPSGKLAERFHQYLNSKGMQNRVDPDEETWNVWIYDEEKLDSGREELKKFLIAPEAEQYSVKVVTPSVQPAKGAAEPIRSRRRGSDQMNLAGIVIAMSVAVTLGTNFGEPSQFTSDMMIAPYGGNLSSIEHGQIWRIYTPMFLHMNPIHIAFNAYMMWVLGGVIERVKGSWNLLLMILLIAPASHFAQYFMEGPNFGGLSGVVYGLLGYIWLRSIYVPEDGFIMPQSVILQMAIWTVLGFAGMLGSIANWAHMGGLAAGALLGVWPYLIQRK